MKLLILILLFSSCSSVELKEWSFKKNKDVALEGYNEFDEIDYLDNLISFEQIYKNDYKKKILRLKRKTYKYLSSILRNIATHNELFFTEDLKSSFTIIESEIPFSFSLPKRKFFLSSALISKYIKNEAMLYSVLVYEFIRSEKNLYHKTKIIPTGTMSTNRMLSLLRLRSKDKAEIHKWAYYLLKRTGIDSGTYLSWLQVQNRNSLDFAIQIGDSQSISREEAVFKAFLIENEKENKDRNRNRHQGSSRNFYAFLNDVRR